MNAIDVLCAQLTRDLFAIAKFLFYNGCTGGVPAGLQYLTQVDGLRVCQDMNMREVAEGKYLAMFCILLV